MLTQDIIEKLKLTDWPRILRIANSLDDCNDAQWRFVKGLVIELALEKYSNPNDIRYVGGVHKDYEWFLLDGLIIDIELKSVVSSSFYTKKGQLRPKISVKLTNSNGTNKKSALSPTDICDVLLILKSDGVVAVDKNTIIANQQSCGDGFMLNLNKSDVVEITGKLEVCYTTLGLKHTIMKAIYDAI